jgi:serine/threonine-protein kinase
MREAPTGLVRRFYVTMSDALPDFGGVLVSPDGRLLVYLDAEGRLRARGVDELESAPIPGTENAWASTFSPDSREIVLSTGFPGALKVVPLSGGAIRTLVADSTYGTGLAWSDDGWIYFLKGADYGRDLMRIRAAGGDAEFIARPDSAAGALFFYWPEALPGGKKLLLTILGYSGESQVGVLDVSSGSVTALATGTMARYVASGHIAVVKADGTLQAAPFDAGSGRVTGAFVTVGRGIARYSYTSHMFSVSQEGTQVFQVEAPPGELVRVARDGSARPLDANWKGNFVNPSLSPDGSRLAVGMLSGGRTELWVRELRTGVLTRLAAGGTLNYRPFWSPDGRDVMFTSDQRGKIGIYQVPADGSAPSALRVAVRPSVDEGAISRDGRWIVLRTGSGGGRDLVAMRTGGDSTLVPLVASSAEEFSPALSPDGRWLAYGSDETGRTEVYVRPFPNAGSAKYVISRGGGSEPQWSPAGGELFYRDGAGNLVAVAIAPGAEFRAASSQVLFPASAYGEDNRHHS